MATTIRTKLSVVLPLLKQRLMSVTGLPTECVVFTVQGSGKPVSFQADWVIEIRLSSAMTEQPIVQGAGRIDTRVVRRMLVITWTRLEVDVDQQAEAFLLDPDLGILDREHKVYEALQMFHPTDSSDNWLLTDTIRLGPVGEPTPVASLEGWSHSEASFEVGYVLALSQDYQ